MQLRSNYLLILLCKYSALRLTDSRFFTKVKENLPDLNFFLLLLILMNFYLLMQLLEIDMPNWVVNLSTTDRIPM